MAANESPNQSTLSASLKTPCEGVAVEQRPDGVTIRISVHDKLNRLPRGNTQAAVKADKARITSASAEGMISAEMTLEQLAAHVAAGYGFAAYMVDGHRCNESAQAQFLVLDDDLGDPEFEANVRALNCAAIVGGTATVGHQRAFLPLVETITDPKAYETLFIRLRFKFGVVVDKAGKVISQPWLGFRAGTMRIIEGDFLSAAEVMSWPAPPSAPVMRREPTPLIEGQIDRHDEYSRMVEQRAPAGKGKREVFRCINPSHADQHPSARIGDGKDGARLYYCTCGTHSLFEVAKWLSLPSYSQWLRENYPAEARLYRPRKPLPPTAQPPAEPEAAPIQPLTLWQAGRYMIVCEEYALIHINICYHGCAENFTKPQLAELLDCSQDKAGGLIDAALQWRLISELTADFEGNEEDQDLPSKKAVNSKRGRKASHYRLTPHLAEDRIRHDLPDYVEPLLEAADPGVIYAEEAAAAGVEDVLGLEQVSAAASSTVEAFEVSAKNERAAVRKARELQNLADLDETPFAADELPCGVRELRTMLIEALWATDPERVWKHEVLKWVAGTKRHNVGALIAKSDKMQPNDRPTLVKVTLEGRDKNAQLRSMQAQCRKERGAPVAWLDARGEVIASFGPNVPEGAKQGLINVGKTYVKRTTPVVTATPHPEPAQRQELPIETEVSEEAKRKAKQARARSVILPRLRGCLLARGWKHIPGPYGYWERDRQIVANTFDAMVQALLLDVAWASAQPTDDGLFAETYDCAVKELA